MLRLGRPLLVATLLVAGACDRPSSPTEAPTPAEPTPTPGPPQTPPAAASEAGPPSSYADYLLPESLMPRFNDLVSQCPDEGVCLFEHDGSVLVAKQSWQSVLMVNFTTPHFPVCIDSPGDELWRARVEFAVRDLLQTRGEDEVMLHCDLAEELPILLPEPPADEQACHEGARQPEHWTRLRIEPSPARTEALLAIIEPSEPGRRTAWAEHQAYEAKEASLGGHAYFAFRMPEVEGALEVSDVARVLMWNRRHLSYCYIDGLLGDPTLAGEAEFQIEIAASGKVSSIEVAVNTMASPDVARCIADEIEVLSFAPAPDGATTRAVWRPEFEPPGSR